MISALIDSFVREFASFVEFIPKLLLAILVYIFIYYIGKILSTISLRIIKRSKMPETYHLFFKKLITGIALFIGFIVFLNIIGYTSLAASLVAGGGLTAVMLGFAFKDIGENFIAGFFLTFNRPFETNDIIESGGILGRVKSIELRHTHIRTNDGCDVFVPSVQLFTRPMHNYTFDGLRRGNFTIKIDYHDDTQKAIEILREAVSNTFGVLKKPATSVQILSLTPNHVELQIHFWINARDQEKKLTEIRTKAMHACKDILLETGFKMS